MSKHKKERYNFSVDQLFPLEHDAISNNKKKFNVETLFSGTADDPNVVIDMSHQILIERRKKRAEDLQKQYMMCYKHCWDKIDASDKDGLTETIFEIPSNLPHYPEYSPTDCINMIQTKLRKEEFMDTIILNNDQSIFINWMNIEKNRESFINNTKNSDH